MSITLAYTAEHFGTMESLARRIVPDFYAPFFERATAEHLVAAGHTAVALKAQAARGYRHYLISWAGEPAGYFALHLCEGAVHGPEGANGAAATGELRAHDVSSASDGQAVQLSHFYVLAEFRGRGLGRLAMDFIDRESASLGAGVIELCVLRRNAGAVAFYQRHGFVVGAEVMTRLGDGAVLEDYLMRKEVE